MNTLGRLTLRFGSEVRRLRRDRGWSQEKLAEFADLNRSYVGEIERGAAEPSLVTIAKLASAFQVELSELLLNCDASLRTRAEAATANRSAHATPHAAASSAGN